MTCIKPGRWQSSAWSLCKQIHTTKLIVCNHPLDMMAGAMVPEYERVKGLIQHLQAMRGRRLWAYEDATLLQARLPSAEALRQLVGAMLASIFFESDLRDRWAATALDWLRTAHSRHLACRSHQVPPPIAQHLGFPLGCSRLVWFWGHLPEQQCRQICVASLMAVSHGFLLVSTPPHHAAATVRLQVPPGVRQRPLSCSHVPTLSGRLHSAQLRHHCIPAC